MRSGCIRAPHAGNRGHPWIIPPTNKPLINQLFQLPFARYGVLEVQPREFNLLRIARNIKLS